MRNNEIYYSQHGEDYLVNKLIGHRRKGVFIEVGCIDGKRFSNTLFFEKKGWTGLCIEAHSDYIELLSINRPNSITVHAAVSDKNIIDSKFYANSRGSLSSLDKSSDKRWITDYPEFFSGFVEQKVREATLTSILIENEVKKIDFLSIDIEGNEISVLKGLDFKKYKPLLILCEYDTKSEYRELSDFLIPHGYSMLHTLRGNVLYGIKTILGSYYPVSNIPTINLMHTEHPLDNTGANLLRIAPDVRNPNSYLKSSILALTNKLKEKLFSNNRNYQLNPLGFHGDEYLIKLVSYLATEKTEYFVETGTNVGSTLKYFAKEFSEIKCHSCEPDYLSFHVALENVSKSHNVNLNQTDSIKFLTTLLSTIHNDLATTLFWLDAHGYGFDWPLQEEVEFILENIKNCVILIDDFKVPGQPQFGYDSYNGQECTLEYIKPSIKNSPDIRLYYPNYQNKTSTFHPLRGWCAITKGEFCKIDLSQKFDFISEYDINAMKYLVHS